MQYVRWVRALISDERGWSPSWHQSVLDGLRQRAPITLEVLFNLNGVGRWAVGAIVETDVPVTVGWIGSAPVPRPATMFCTDRRSP